MFNPSKKVQKVGSKYQTESTFDIQINWREKWVGRTQISVICIQVAGTSKSPKPLFKREKIYNYFLKLIV